MNRKTIVLLILTTTVLAILCQNILFSYFNQERYQKSYARELKTGQRINTNPNFDADADGISDRDEELIFETNINNPDTDNDGFSDLEEIAFCYNPNSNKNQEYTNQDGVNEKLIGKVKYFQAFNWRERAVLKPIDPPLIYILNSTILTSTCAQPDVNITTPNFLEPNK